MRTQGLQNNIQKREKRHTEDKGRKRYGKREREIERERKKVSQQERETAVKGKNP